MSSNIELSNPFTIQDRNDVVNVGTINIEQSRAIAEAQAKLIIAKGNPRNEARAYDKIITACSRQRLAETAHYTYPRGGVTVSGPSIRLMEEVARCWGNIDYGLKELSRTEGKSEILAYAWDLESNVSSTMTFTVSHLRDKKGGAIVLTDQRDIYELVANMGARRLRARLMAVIPNDIIEAAEQACKKVLAGDVSIPLADRVKRTIDKFKKINITEKHLSTYLGKSLDDVIEDDLAMLFGVYNAIKDGQSASGYFDIKAVEGAAKQLNDDFLLEEPQETVTKPTNNKGK